MNPHAPIALSALLLLACADKEPQAKLKGAAQLMAPETEATRSGPATQKNQAESSSRLAALETSSNFASGLDAREAQRKSGHQGVPIGEMSGGWGYGVASGHASGAGGTGWATIGSGNYGTIGRGPSTEDYKNYGHNDQVASAEDHLSTFAIDVDTASYSIFRRKRQGGIAVPPNSVRTEEFLNYFRYAYQGPSKGKPFAVHMDAAPSPYSANRHILRVGVQGKRISKSERKNAHLVFLVDVSGSMNSPDKLTLAKHALRILVDNLNDGDTVALVTYAGNVREVLKPTGLEHRAQILSAIEDLSASGSTAMGSGLQIAYEMAASRLGPDSLSRVVVLSDGDANVGKTGHEQILKTIRAQVKEGVTLSTIGFGMGNYKDHLMEQLANKGNGNYYYVDGLPQAKRIFQEELGGTLEVIAKDVKIQVEFDPEQVKGYRLLGYENRDIADKDFRDDKVDAGELGAGHTVTALYELDIVKQSKEPLATVRLRAKKPRGTKASETVATLHAAQLQPSFDQASADFRFAVAVAGAAEIYRKNPLAEDWSLAQVKRIAKDAAGDSSERNEFVRLLD
jgi:Ca-activated chloride channel family protein